MGRGAEYLTFVTGLLKDRLAQLEEKIGAVQKDIGEMHDYYWQNYTEMDQYGYENYDNQQALLAQVNANAENQRMKSRLKRMLDSPFFGSVDFVYEGEEEPEVFYIGIGSFAQRTGQTPLIYDWRAPVSSLFYDYDKGEASYEAPGGAMDGEIVSKWQYKVRDGKLIYEFESDTKIDDDILKQELGANSDTQLKNIVRTIQKEQNAIIRNTKDKILIIQGAAGSGKTSIALHRIAYLLYHDRDHLKSSNVLVLSPNGVFSDYISHVLPELGEENIQEMSFDLFAYRNLQDVASDCEDRFHYIEHQIRGGASEYGAWKQSEEYVRSVEGFLIDLEDRLVEFSEVEYRGVRMRADELMHLFYDKFPDVPVLARMDTVMECFIDEVETLRDRTLSEDELESIKERFQKMYVTRDVFQIYNWLLEECGLPQIPYAPREQRILEYEDVYPVLYLKQRLLGGSRRSNIRHLVIDEMQDYSYLQYVILENMFSCNMTILGDRAQTVDGSAQDVQTFLPKIFGRHVRRIELNKSYRNTAQISQYAAEISGVTGIEYMNRQGKDVVLSEFFDLSEAVDAILAHAELGDGGYETAAVLTMTEEEAKKCFALLEDRFASVSYIDRDSTAFQKGITVTTYYQAKGLEFDQVFVVGGEKDNPFYPQFQYISATRALHELYVYSLR